MPRLRPTHEQPDATADDLADLARPTADELPPRRRGGQELPDEVQDRPEQNAGYDEAVRGEDVEPSVETVAEADVEGADAIVGAPGGRRSDEPLSPEMAAHERAEAIDTRAEQDAIAEVRNRERKNR
jgi:hypothetical protein